MTLGYMTSCARVVLLIYYGDIYNSQLTLTLFCLS